ncbi:MAG TPA: O-antigen ligase domain-containing protein, partial [Coprothermobacter proteolyticus]|nr:O-antigen ligase domain-containing protein [Coprothermobacter proteolyticus]
MFSLAPWRTLLFWLLVPLVYCFIVFVIAVLPEHVDSRKLAFITGFLLVISFLWTVYKNGGVVNFSGWRTFRLTLPFFVSTTSAAFFTYFFLYAYSQHVFWAELFSLVSLLLTQSRGP